MITILAIIMIATMDYMYTADTNLQLPQVWTFHLQLSSTRVHLEHYSLCLLIWYSKNTQRCNYDCMNVTMIATTVEVIGSYSKL